MMVGESDNAENSTVLLGMTFDHATPVFFLGRSIPIHWLFIGQGHASNSLVTNQGTDRLTLPISALNFGPQEHFTSVLVMTLTNIAPHEFGSSRFPEVSDI